MKLIQKFLKSGMESALADCGVKAQTAAHEKTPGKSRGGDRTDPKRFCPGGGEDALQRFFGIRFQMKAPGQVVSRSRKECSRR